MNNKIQIFNFQKENQSEIIDSLRKSELELAAIMSNGWLYALEYGDLVKIGCTSSLSKRMRFLIHQGMDYADLPIGRLVISIPCVNYKDLESLLHRKFDSNRKQGTELFSISFDDVVKAMELLQYDQDFVSADSAIKQKGDDMVVFAKELLGYDAYLKESDFISKTLDTVKYLHGIIEQQGANVEQLMDFMDFQRRYIETLETIIIKLRDGKIELSLLDCFISNLTSK